MDKFYLCYNEFELENLIDYFARKYKLIILCGF